jgi:glutathione synthase/RimK-type ligase-like ATP-grasp enzyme
MIAIMYGAAAEPWVGAVAADIQAAAEARGGEIVRLTLETVLRAHREWHSVRRLYVLPFDVPPDLPEDLPFDGALLVRALFPRAEVLNALPTHALCWDKIAAAQRLHERGIAMPETLITMDPDEARAFVGHHQHAILKEPRSAGGHGHVVLFADRDGTIGGEVPGRRYAVEMVRSGVGRQLRHGVLSCPPPFYLQRLVTDVGRGGVLRPGQILRAYVVDGQIAFWSERRRDKIRRPADFIISATFGARYHFIRAVSDTVETLARRAAEALGMRIGAVDVIRAGDQGPFVLEADTDGQHLIIDRSFKRLPEYRDVFDFDALIAAQLLAGVPEVKTRTLGVERQERPPGLPRHRPR